MSAVTMSATRPHTAPALERVTGGLLLGFAAALQVSIALAQILLAAMFVFWIALRIQDRTRPAAPPFFVALLAYGGLTLVSAAFSVDPMASLIDSKQLVLLAIVPAVYDLARAINRGRDETADVGDAQATLRELTGVLGLRLEESAGVAALDVVALSKLASRYQVSCGGTDAESTIEALLAHRQEVRASCDFGRADAIRAGNVARVWTPHLGEFKAAFPDQAQLVTTDRFAAVVEAAKPVDRDTDVIELTGAIQTFTVLLKGVPTVIASRDASVRVAGSGNPGLATGGSGDVLSGFIAAFLAQGLDTRDAGSLGAHTLGRAAEVASTKGSVRTVLPDDVIAAVPDVWRRLESTPAVEPPVLLALDVPAVV